ncbi:hypothetical protein [Nonomuraea sp. CA-141351]|uniref:hypothetical protein n=1 Tax=Nonomuraea sp. CA-141351 TaxID=3239996 RepID=UPI003D8A8EA4
MDARKRETGRTRGSEDAPAREPDGSGEWTRAFDGTGPGLDGGRLLDPLRDVEPAPTGRVNVAAAVRAGRRRARTRAALGAAAAVSAVVAVIAMTTVLGRQAAQPAPAVARQSGFDVLTKAFTVGSAGGFTPDTYATGRLVQRVTLRPADPSRSGDAVIELYAQGVLPRSADGPAAPSVNGRPAIWPRDPVLRKGTAEVAWQWGPQAWGVVSVKGGDREIAHRVAQSVLPGGDERVDVPFTVPGEPGVLVGAVTSYSAPYKVGLRYDDAGSWLEVGVEERTSALKPGTTVRGLPAVREERRVTVLRDGYAAYAEAGRAGWADRLGELASAITLAPDSGWPGEPSPACTRPGSGTGATTPACATASPR